MTLPFFVKIMLLAKSSKSSYASLFLQAYLLAKICESDESKEFLKEKIDLANKLAYGAVKNKFLKDKPHCHLIVWNKNQDMSVQRKPFVNYKQILNKMAKLEEVSKSFKRGFIYKYQEPESKRVLNEITMLLVNSNEDCKNEFNRYVDTCVKIDKMLQKVDTYKDYEKIKNQARNEMIKKIGNQILKSIKETKTEEYKRKSVEWKEKREYWNFKTKEFEEKQGEYEARQLLYENQLRESNIRQLIQETYKLLESMSKFQRFKRATRTFGDLSKREIKEMMKKNKNSGIDWYNEL